MYTCTLGCDQKIINYSGMRSCHIFGGFAYYRERKVLEEEDEEQIIKVAINK